MLLSLKQLFEVIGDSQPVEYALELPDCELGGTALFPQPVSVKGQVYNRAGIVTLDVVCDMTMHLVCDRCLTAFERRLSLPVQHVLVTKTNTDQDEFVVVEDMTLDVDELLRADILLSLPSKILCKQDCKGLCSVCGANRNERDCRCEEKSVDPRLEILGDLFK